jgi:hypothetical protein
MSTLYGVRKIINNNRILERIYYLLKSIIRIIPFYLVQEGDSIETCNSIKTKLDANRLVVDQLGISDMKVLSQNPETNASKEELIDRLKNNWHCMGIRYEQSIISYLWYNLKESEKILSFKLNSDEAYITDVRTFEAYRGKNLAPYLRCELYKYLRKIGRNKFYSIIFSYNDPAIRVMKKNNAKLIKLYFSIRITRKFVWNIVLKSFS